MKLYKQATCGALKPTRLHSYVKPVKTKHAESGSTVRPLKLSPLPWIIV